MKQRAKTRLAVLASALTLLLAAVLLGTALASLSRPAAVPAALFLNVLTDICSFTRPFCRRTRNTS